jgi:hypothetical protein
MIRRDQLWSGGGPRRTKAKRRLADVLLPRRFFRRNAAAVPPIPMFMFHQPMSDSWERICRRIDRAEIATVSSTALLDGDGGSDAGVCLTFDDGWSSVWSIAFPIVRRFGLRIVVFLLPALVEESEELRATLDDGAEPAELAARDRGARCYLTWGEVRAMHESGLVDVQSHSLHHGVVFAEDRVIGEMVAGADLPLPGRVPLVLSRNGFDQAMRSLPAGIPLHPIAPALAATQRYLPSDGAGSARFESDVERSARLRHDIAEAKALIEARLPGHRVRALAPPWSAMHPDLPGIAAEVGYELIAMGYPFDPPASAALIPIHPRLKGDAVWPLLDGPLGGALAMLRARRRTAEWIRDGGIP